MGFMGFSPTDLPQEDDQRPQIARPQAVSATPPLTLRGVTPPDAGSSAPPEPLHPTMQPPPGQEQLGTDQTELDRLKNTGSGISQIQKNHPIAGGVLRGLDVAGKIGSAFLPELRPVMSAIPGTEEHHQELVDQQAGRVATDQSQQDKQAVTAKTQAETGAVPGEIEERAANTAHLNAETKAAGQPKPKEENWADFTGWTDKDGTPLLREANSGQVVRADNKQPPAGFQQAKPGKPDTPEQQFYDSAEEQGKTQTQKTQDWARASQRPEQPQKPQQQLVVGKDGKVVELHPGDQIPEGAQSIQSLEKSSQAGEASQAAMNYANDYMAGKQFTGAGDEALMEKYFELAKPSSGFRMTQPQIEMLTKAQDIMNSVVAKGKHLFSPNAPYFSPDLRQQIVQTMNTLQHAKTEKPATQGGGSSGFQAPAGAPPAPQQDGHKLKMNGNVIAISKGGAWVAPPANSK